MADPTLIDKLEVKVGDEFTIHHQTAVHIDAILSFSETDLELVKKEPLSGALPVGAGPNVKYVFKALTEGEHTIGFESVAKWDITESYGIEFYLVDAKK